MNHLYELTGHYIKALDFLTDPENEIDTQTAVDTIESLDGEIDDKILNVARMIAMLEHEAAGIKEVSRRQSDRAKSVENRAGWLREYLLSNMQASGHNKASANDIVVSLAKTPASVKVINESQIPPEFWKEKIEVSIDKTAIKNAGGCSGVSIETGYRVSIK